MAGSFSDFLELEVLDHIMGVGSYTMPTVFLALCTADPTDAGTGASMNEVTNAGAYARIAIAADFATPAAGGAISNDGQIDFVQSSGSWGTITHWALVDSGTHGAGNMLAHGDLTASQAISSGTDVSVAIGDLDVTLD